MHPNLSFGRSISNIENAPLRERIAAVTANFPARRIHCDTVLGFSKPQWQGSILFLLFDYHRMLIYENPPEFLTGVDSLIRCVVDDYPYQPFHLFARHAETHAFVFMYDLQLLDILEFLLPEIPDRIVLTLDFIKGEIRKAQAHVHPQFQLVQDKTPLHSNGHPSHCSPLLDRIVGPGLRTGNLPALDNLTSLDIGPIRNEHITLRDSIIPSVVACIGSKHGASQIVCGSKGFSVRRVQRVARLEAIERYHVTFPPSAGNFVHSTYKELGERAINPADLCFAMVNNAGEPATDMWAEYNDSLLIYWTSALDPLTNKSYFVPAQEAYSTLDLPDESTLVPNTTSACAIGSCLEEAFLFAVLEALERDAFLIMWYIRRSCRQISPSSVSYEPFQLLWARIKSDFPNYGIHLFDISSDAPVPIVAAIAVRRYGIGPRTVHASASRLEAGQSLYRALLDLAAELEHGRRAKVRSELLDKPELITTPEDHRDLYALDAMFDRLSFLDFDELPRTSAAELNRNSILPHQEQYNLKTVLCDLLLRCQERGIRLLLKDITQPQFAARGLCCVRAIAVGLYPIWFGHYNRRFAITDRLRSLGVHFTGRPIHQVCDVNLEIHPLS